MFRFLFVFSFLGLFCNGFAATAEERATAAPVRIVIHGGIPKTGSSCFQQFCAVNHRALQKQGIYYPFDEDGASSARATRHKGNVCAYKKTNFRQLVKEARKRSCHTLLLSTEGFFREPEEAKKLNGLNATIVIGVRDLYPLMWSARQEYTKFMAAPYETFEALMLPGSKSQNYFGESQLFENHLAFWKAVSDAGQDTHFAFFNFEHHKRDLVETIFGAAKLEVDFGALSRVDLERPVNRSLTASEYNLMVFLWQMKVPPKRRIQILEGLYRKKPKAPAFKYFSADVARMCYEQGAEIVAHFNMHLPAEERLATEMPLSIEGYTDVLPQIIDRADWDVALGIWANLKKHQASLGTHGLSLVD